MSEVDRDYVYRYIRGKLGSPHVPVELEDEQIDLCVDDSLRIFNHYIGEFEWGAAYNLTDNAIIDLSDVEGVKGVVSVKAMFPEAYRVYAQMNIFEIMYRMVFPRLPIGEWYLLRSFYDMYQRVRGTEPDFEFDVSSKKLYVDCWSGPYDVCYIISKELTLEGVNRSKPMYKDLLLKAILANAKLILSSIRGKWGDAIPAPHGNLSTDAPVLRDQGMRELEEVEEAIQNTADVQVPIFG